MPRVKTFNEQEVLENAMNLFWEKGYAATSIQDLVNHLGINRASLYDTYGGKKELFLKSFAYYRNKNISGLKAFFKAHPDVKKGFKTLFNIAVDESVNDPARKGCFVVNTTTELIPGDTEILHILSENKITLENLFFNYLQLGEEEQQFGRGKDLKSIASFLYTLYSGIRVIGKVAPDKVKISKTVDIALSVLN
ncbi:transcriptional regulator, TetR family [Zhouia amylolytica]|uniref:Transcriptional regulator, TetR family n=1 Tax=Zhouia amylolytica TaxID=376730 RepID=A0A1I6QQF5_9FLAO|nr:TetR/AcrR family transcriptional regulator [Zhouia amylolytica]MCQ0112025.1 TetR/AcrR family transcriptional regulator [Zhouia amylolytica]SFS54706.1 transcriptional regulator, TetR family [Zhouia amylolytica]